MFANNEISYWYRLNQHQRNNILLRPNIIASDDLKTRIKLILDEIRRCGDNAIFKYTKIFDKIDLKTITVSQDRINNSEFIISDSLKHAILIAKKNIQFFHNKQKINSIDVYTQVGVRCQQVFTPIQSVGLYVPGGSAPLLSTALMLSIPAIIAGCKNIILCSPPPISNEILYIAKLCNIHHVFEVGGAQAIAALGFGTQTIPKVNKIFGPGNLYVTEAKIQLTQLLPGLAIDMIAGPSELLIIIDKTANPAFVAADVLSQSEHGVDSQVIIVSDNINILQKVLLHINQQVSSLSRKNIILKSLKNHQFILTKDLSECIQISNMYAPEHLIIQTKYPRKLIHGITNAGSIFLGPWSPESVGDYASGTNHVLPTNGYAVAASGLGIIDFQKKMTIQELTPFGLKNIAKVVQTLAFSEKMDAHAHAVTVRCNAMKDKYGK